MPLEHPNPMLVSLVPITFGPGADLMGTGSSQIVNVRPLQATSPQIVIDNSPPVLDCRRLRQRTFPRLNDANRHYSTNT